MDSRFSRPIIHQLPITRKEVEARRFPRSRWPVGGQVIVAISMAFLLAWGGALGCLPNERDVVRVAVSLPLRVGDVPGMLAAIEMALEDAGRSAGRWKVELLVFDTSLVDGDGLFSEELERRAAREAVRDPSVVAYLGSPFTSLSKVSLPLTNAAGLAQVSQTASWPGLTRPGFAPGEPGIYFPSGRRTFFRVVPPDDEQGLAAARWAVDLGAKTVFVIDSGTVYGSGIAGIFDGAVRDLGLEVLGHRSLVPELFEEGAEKLEALVETVIRMEPDLLYFGGTPSEGGIRVIGELRSLGSDLPVLGSDGFVGEDLSVHLPVAWIEGLCATSPGLPTVAREPEELRAFREAFEGRHGKAPLPSVVRSYEAMGVILAAIERAETPDRESVLTALLALDFHQGVLGTWSFDSFGDTSLREFDRMRFEGGQWRLSESESLFDSAAGDVLP